MTIAIYGRSFHDSFIPEIQRLFDELAQREAQLYIFEAFSSYLRPRVTLQGSPVLFKRHEEIAGKVDFLISIGGDGSILDSVTLVRDAGIPILGINTGRLGFLSNISKEEIGRVIETLFDGKYKIEQRALIRVETGHGIFNKLNFALNELTIHRKDSSSMMTIHAYLNEQYLNSYWADGLIIATPTGSTAYSLSCGGPIVVPGSENFIITPVAPHNLNVRPIVLSDNTVIRLKIEGRGRHYLATLDSRTHTVDAEIELTVRKAPFKIRLIQLPEQNFPQTIRHKLMWGLDRRN